MLEKPLASTLVGWLFVLANGGRLLAYIPQIIAAARCDTGAKSVSLLTWAYFAFAHLSALLYAAEVLHDQRSIWIFTGNLCVTLLLVGLLGWKRCEHTRRVAAPMAAQQRSTTNGDRRNRN